jgi:hypothetical protein
LGDGTNIPGPAAGQFEKLVFPYFYQDRHLRPALRALARGGAERLFSPRIVRQIPQPLGEAVMSEKTLSELFHDTLKDIYYAEKKILSALPKMANAAHGKRHAVSSVAQCLRKARDRNRGAD